MGRIDKLVDKKELFGFQLVENNSEESAFNDDKHKINIFIKKNPETDNDVHSYRCSMSEDMLNIELPKLGKFKVESGNRITITHNSDIAPEETLVFLYGSCMGASLYQRGIIPLHGSAVLTQKGAVLFLGVSGTGKSTTAAALMQRGYSIISDDISAVKLEGKNAVLLPSNADLKLWKRSLDMLQKSPKGLIKVRNKLEKYYLPLKTDYDNNKSYPVSKIYILKTHNEETIELSKPLKGKEKFNRIHNHAYRKRFIKGLNRQKEHYTTMMCLLSKSEVITVTRPQTGYFKELVDAIEKDMLNEH